MKGKLENIKQEMKRNKIDVLGLSEVRWKEGGDLTSDEYRIIYTGGGQKQRRVAIVAHQEMARRIIEIEQISDRLHVVMVKFNTEPAHLVVVQVYMPTSESDEEEMEQMYDQLEDLLERQKENDM